MDKLSWPFPVSFDVGDARFDWPAIEEIDRILETENEPAAILVTRRGRTSVKRIRWE